MRARRGRGRDRLTLNAEINVVSLIDVMMLLMIIFMITAPMMQGGVDISLPKAQSRPLESKSGLTVTIDRAGAIYVDDARLTFNQFSASFKALARRRGSGGVYLRADDGVPVDACITNDLGTTFIMGGGGPAGRGQAPPAWASNLGVNAFPLKVSKGGKTMLVVTSIEKKPLDSSLFVAPADYHTIGGMPSMPRH